jgi:hypothetical protein
MISFWGEDCLKKAVIARVKEHQRLDQIIQGTYWDGARGCAIGCALHSGDHMAFETQLGLPVFIAYMDEHIFEQLPLQEAKLWPLRLIEALPVGVDLHLVFPRFMHWLLRDPHGMRESADARTRRIIDDLTLLYARRIHGLLFDQASAEASAEAARACAEAARGRTRACAQASAWASAWAAWASVQAARVSAEASAWAAQASVQAARVSAIRRQADYLIAMLQSYESKPVRVTAPCDPAQDVSELIAEAQRR